MSYYRLLGLAREPFSTSPDPSFYYHAAGHQTALFRTGVTIQLKRGLSVLFGDVGTGKTTLSRRLFQLFERHPQVRFHVLLNPAYTSELEFFHALLETFHLKPSSEEMSTPFRCLQQIETELYRKAVEQNLTMVLIIDEAQKLTDSALEVLRALLNYETNDMKLLQLVLLSQMELVPRLQGMRNLWDRVSFRYQLDPLDERETGEMIRFRLQAAGFHGRHELFTEEAIRLMYQRTNGYPRRIAVMAHNALEGLVMYDRRQVDSALMRQMVEQESFAEPAAVAAASGSRTTAGEPVAVAAS